MRPLSLAALLLAAALLPPLARADVQEVDLDELEGLARLSFSIESGRCEAEAGPDGHSVRLLCPPSSDDVARLASESFAGSAVRVDVHQSETGVEVDVSLPSPLAGYHLEQGRRRVSLDVGRRTPSTELPRIEAESRLPLADEDDAQPFAEVDRALVQRDLGAAREALAKLAADARPELQALREGDIAFLSGDRDAAASRYAEAAAQYNTRCAGKLAALRLAELQTLSSDTVLVQPTIPELPPLDPQAKRAAAASWLVAARLARWRLDHAEAIRLADSLDRPEIDSGVAIRARKVRDESVAALLLDADRRHDPGSVAREAVNREKLVLAHPALDRLAGPASAALMRMSLPDRAAKVLQALVEGSESDRQVVATAPNLAEAYLEAFQVYRATQVVEYALAVSRGEADAARLLGLRARIAVAEGRGRDALTAVETVAAAPPRDVLVASVAAMQDGDAGRAAARLDALSASCPRTLRREVELARAEAHALARLEDGPELVRLAVLGAPRDGRGARLAYLRAAAIERSGDLASAGAAYSGVVGDERWERLAALSARSVRLSAVAEPPAEPEPEAARRRPAAATAPEEPTPAAAGESPTAADAEEPSAPAEAAEETPAADSPEEDEETDGAEASGDAP